MVREESELRGSWIGRGRVSMVAARPGGGHQAKWWGIERDRELMAHGRRATRPHGGADFAPRERLRRDATQIVSDKLRSGSGARFSLSVLRTQRRSALSAAGVYAREGVLDFREPSLAAVFLALASRCPLWFAKGRVTDS